MNPMKTPEKSKKDKDALATKAKPSDNAQPEADMKPKRDTGTEKPNSSQPGPLPDGWQEATDPSTGRTYYVNKRTSVSQWTRPTTDAPATPGTLPEGWQEVTDPSSGKKYFYNHRTSATQWHRPT